MAEECLWGETEEAPRLSFHFHETGLQQVRNWMQKQRFIPRDLSNEFLQRFLNATNDDVQSATKMIHDYFYLRQEPGLIFRDRNPELPINQDQFNSLYAVPIQNLLNNGELILLTGLLRQRTNYSVSGHLKLIAITLDYLIWNDKNKFIDLKILMDGRNFLCPSLLGIPSKDILLEATKFQKSLPFKFRGFYIYHPPEHVKEIARIQNGIWLNVMETPEEVSLMFPSSMLPFEFGGSLGYLSEILDDWNLQMGRLVKFLLQFEKRMVNDYRRRLCHEKEVAEGGKNWVAKMKLVEEESEYKRRYYENLANQKPILHSGFGKLRLKSKSRVIRPYDPLREIRMLIEEKSFGFFSSLAEE